MSAKVKKDKWVLITKKRPFCAFFCYFIFIVICVTILIILRARPVFCIMIGSTAIPILVLQAMTERFVVLYKDRVKSVSSLGMTDKEEKLDNLEKVEIIAFDAKRLFKRKKEEYIVLFFRGHGEIEQNTFYSVRENAHTIPLIATERNVKILREYLPEEFKSCFG